MDMEKENFAQTIADLAKEAVAVPEGVRKKLDELQLTALPKEAVLVDIAARLPHPQRAAAKVELYDPADFAEYVNRYKTPATIIFADPEQMRVRAVMDYHEKEAANWAQHHAVYPCPVTAEFAAWRKINDTFVSQSEFAEFLEEHVAEVVEPDGAVLHEAVQYLIAHKTVSYKSAKDLHSGDIQLVYEEETETRSRQGEARLPKRFTLGIRVFRGGEVHRFDALLRYRINEHRQLQFKFKIHRLDDVREAAFKAVVDEIAEQIDALDEFEVPILMAKDEPGLLCRSPGLGEATRVRA